MNPKSLWIGLKTFFSGVISKFFLCRLHTHLHHHHHHHNHDNNNSTKSNISPSKNNKKKTSTTSQWLSPARNRPRSKSLDDTNADPSNTSTSITDSNSEDDKSDAKTNDKDNSRYVYWGTEGRDNIIDYEERLQSIFYWILFLLVLFNTFITLTKVIHLQNSSKLNNIILHFLWKNLHKIPSVCKKRLTARHFSLEIIWLVQTKNQVKKIFFVFIHFCYTLFWFLVTMYVSKDHIHFESTTSCKIKPFT